MLAIITARELAEKLLEHPDYMVKVGVEQHLFGDSVYSMEHIKERIAMRTNFRSIKVEAAPGSYLPSFMQDLQELSKCYGCAVVGVFNGREIAVGENNNCVYVG